MSTSTPDAPGGPWRMLILNRDAEDPHWVIATVTLPIDVRPARLDPAGRYEDWREITEWVRQQTGGQLSLPPVSDACVWQIDQVRRGH
jgi:hypothetical protein